MAINTPVKNPLQKGSKREPPLNWQTARIRVLAEDLVSRFCLQPHESLNDTQTAVISRAPHICHGRVFIESLLYPEIGIGEGIVEDKDRGICMFLLHSTCTYKWIMQISFLIIQWEQITSHPSFS